jgi:hypothetical protein
MSPMLKLSANSLLSLLLRQNLVIVLACNHLLPFRRVEIFTLGSTKESSNGASSSYYIFPKNLTAEASTALAISPQQ